MVSPSAVKQIHDKSQNRRRGNSAWRGNAPVVLTRMAVPGYNRLMTNTRITVLKTLAGT